MKLNKDDESRTAEQLKYFTSLDGRNVFIDRRSSRILETQSSMCVSIDVFQSMTLAIFICKEAQLASVLHRFIVNSNLNKGKV